jgi:hypothetical protein
LVASKALNYISVVSCTFIERAFNYFAQKPFLFVLNDGLLGCESEMRAVKTLHWLLSFILTHDAMSHFASGTVVVEMSLFETNSTHVCFFFRGYYNGFNNADASHCKALVWLAPVP